MLKQASARLLCLAVQTMAIASQGSPVHRLWVDVHSSKLQALVHRTWGTPNATKHTELSLPHIGTCNSRRLNVFNFPITDSRGEMTACGKTQSSDSAQTDKQGAGPPGTLADREMTCRMPKEFTGLKEGAPSVQERRHKVPACSPQSILCGQMAGEMRLAVGCSLPGPGA